MSQRATISPCRPASLVSLSPLPPTPMQAKRTFSFGDGGLNERAKAGALARRNVPVPATADCLEELTTVHGEKLLRLG